MNGKINLLVILPWVPFDLNNGGNQAMFNGLETIQNDVNLFIVYNIGRKNTHTQKAYKKFMGMLPNANHLPYFESITEKKYFIKKIFSKLQSRLLRESVEDIEISHMYDYLPKDEKYLQFINKQIREFNIDIVQTEMLRNSSLVFALPDNVRKVFVHHELGFVRNTLFCKKVDSLYAKSMAKLAKGSEIDTLNHYDGVITLSSIDANKLKQEGVIKPIFNSFAIVDTDADSNIQCNNYNVLTFVGPERHTPNFIGLNWFLDNCWNNLLNLDSSYELRVIGNWSEQTKKAITEKYRNVRFLGFVGDLSESLKNTIMIVPITIGSGIRMKILEAASIGVPFVSTKVGAEGLPFIDGIDAFISDDAEIFYNNIISLKDANLRMQFALNSNLKVKQSYSKKALKLNRLKIYNEILYNSKN